MLGLPGETTMTSRVHAFTKTNPFPRRVAHLALDRPLSCFLPQAQHTPLGTTRKKAVRRQIRTWSGLAYPSPSARGFAREGRTPLDPSAPVPGGSSTFCPRAGRAAEGKDFYDAVSHAVGAFRRSVPRRHLPAAGPPAPRTPATASPPPRLCAKTELFRRGPSPRNLSAPHPSLTLHLCYPDSGKDRRPRVLESLPHEASALQPVLAFVCLARPLPSYAFSSPGRARRGSEKGLHPCVPPGIRTTRGEIARAPDFRPGRSGKKPAAAPCPSLSFAQDCGLDFFGRNHLPAVPSRRCHLGRALQVAQVCARTITRPPSSPSRKPNFPARILASRESRRWRCAKRPRLFSVLNGPHFPEHRARQVRHAPFSFFPRRRGS